jgi:polysaccharide biosynthesis transport protein
VASVPGSPRSRQRQGRRTSRTRETPVVPTPPPAPERELGDVPIETGHYVELLRRNRLLIALVALGVTLAALVLAVAMSDSYRSTARILLDSSADPLEPSDADSIARRLATAERIVMTPRILAAAAARVSGETARSLEEKVEGAADADANIIDVTASDGEPAESARIANAVATAFIADQRRLALADVRQTRTALRARLEALGSSSVAASQRDALAAQLGELELRAASVGRVFRLVERAEPPEESSTPSPLGVALLGLIAGIVIAVLVVFGRDYLKPQITDAHALGRLVGAPVVARLAPSAGDSRAPDAIAVSVEGEAFRSLRGRAARLLDPSRQQHVVLVTGPLGGLTREAVSAGLARALAENGERTLLVATRPAAVWRTSTDGARYAVLEDVGAGGRESPAEYVASLAKHLALIAGTSTGVAVLADAHKLWDDEQRVGYETARAFIETLRGAGYTHVVVDAPPLLETNDSLILAEGADAVVAVAELDGVSQATALDMGDALREMNTQVLGLIVVEHRTRRVQLPQLLGGREPVEASPARVRPWWTDNVVHSELDASRALADGRWARPGTSQQSSS